MAKIIGTTGGDFFSNGTTGADTFYTGVGNDRVLASGGSDLLNLGFKTSVQNFRYGFNDFDRVDYGSVWSNLGLANATTVRIVADLQAGTVQKFNGSVLLGTDRLVGVDSVAGTEANDSFSGRNFWNYEEFTGLGGNDTINGRGHEDFANYSHATASGITVNLAAGTVTGAEVGTDTLREIEGIFGTRFDDTYNASGYSGSSTNRNSFGQEGNVFTPLAGNDTVTGNGHTLINYSGVGGALTINLAGQTALGTTSHIVTGFVADADPGTFSAGDLTVSGVNFVIAGNFDDTLIGGGRVNTLGSASTLSGDSSYESFRGGGGDDSITGGTGFDRADFRQSTPMSEGITVELAAGIVSGDLIAVGVDTLRGIESVRGTHQDDVYDARGFTLSNASVQSANNGDATLTAPSGETLPSNAFNEFVGGVGTDTVIGNGATRLTLEVHVENPVGTSAIVVFTSAQAGHAETGLTDGGLGEVNFTGTFSVRGGNGNDSLTGAAGFQNLQGGFGNDTLLGGDGADVLHGYHGGDLAALNLSTTFSDNDSLDGGAGNDRLRGDFGNDILQGGLGADTMEGGTGDDTYHVDSLGDVITELSPGGNDTVLSTLANYTMHANIETGRIDTAAAANLTGNALPNTLIAGNGNNTINGGVGTEVDTLSYQFGATSGITLSLALATAQATGGSGSDTVTRIENLIGSGFADALTGSAANNVLTGGLGQDTLRGNGGNDLFDLNAPAESGITSTTWDVITDFDSGDRIDLSTLDANTATSINDAFNATFVSSFTAAGQLRYDSVAQVLFGNTDADSTAEFALQLTGVSSLAATAIIL